MWSSLHQFVIFLPCPAGYFCVPPHRAGAPTPAAAVRSGRQQRLHHHHGQKVSQRPHGLPVLHQGNLQANTAP